MNLETAIESLAIDSSINEELSNLDAIKFREYINGARKWLDREYLKEIGLKFRKHNFGFNIAIDGDILKINIVKNESAIFKIVVRYINGQACFFDSELKSLLFTKEVHTLSDQIHAEEIFLNIICAIRNSSTFPLTTRPINLTLDNIPSQK